MNETFSCGAKLRIDQLVRRAFFGAMAVIVVIWAVAVDLWVAAAWIHPIACALALAPVTLLVAGSLTLLCQTHGSVIWVSWAAFILSALVVVVPWNPRKRFVADLYSVRHGMAVGEVEALMVGYIRGVGGGWRVPEGSLPLVRGLGDPQDICPTTSARAASDTYCEPDYSTGEAHLHLTGTIVYRWSGDASYNSDWGRVDFFDGRVVRVEFLPD